jgi:hypothetical protein
MLSGTTFPLPMHHTGNATKLLSPQPTGTLRNNSGSNGSAASFRVGLEQLISREKSPIPIIVLKCVEAIEERGMYVPALYRSPATPSVVQQLRAQFDHDSNRVDLSNCQAQDVAALLKLWLKEMPEPVFTRRAYSQLVEAASTNYL